MNQNLIISNLPLHSVSTLNVFNIVIFCFTTKNDEQNYYASPNILFFIHMFPHAHILNFDIYY